MSVLKCPYCGTAVSERELLSHPPNEPAVKSVLPHTYCPSCAGEVRVSRDAPWWYIIYVVGAFALSFWLFHFAETTSPALAYWVKLIGYMIPACLVLVFQYTSRRLLPCKPNYSLKRTATGRLR